MSKKQNDKRTSSWKLFTKVYSFLDKKDKKLVIIGSIISFLNALFYVSGTTLTGVIISLFFNQKMFDTSGKVIPGSFDVKKFIIWNTFLALCFIFYATVRLIQSRILISVAYKAASKMRKIAMEKLIDMPISFYDKEKSGDLISVLVNDINNLANSLVQMFNETLSNIFNVLVSTMAMTFVSLTLTSIVVPLSILFFSLAYIMINKAQKAYVKVQQNFGDLNAYVEEMLTNSKITKTFDQQESAKKSFEKITNDIYKNAFKGDVYIKLFDPWFIVSTNLLVLLLSLFAILFNINGVPTLSVFSFFKRPDAGLMIAYTSLLWNYTGTLQVFFNVIFSIQIGLSSTKRVFRLLELDMPTSVKNPIELSDIKGHIEFRNVSFKYDKDSSKYQLKNATFEALPGQTIAIVGPTGAGKTTIINLLSKFYEYDEGVIKIDGVDLAKITKKNLRNLMSVVLQDSFMFNESIMSNLKVASDKITNQEVYEMASLTSAHNFIQKLEKGYDTVIENSGQCLSQGERQLLSITRALLGKKKVLILDEATSNVDSNTEQIIQRALQEELMKDRTSIVIAHRLSTIKNADKILVVDDGQIIEQGNHESLMRLKGYYFNLYENQFK
ncbi:ABC transporter ATP-binding protein/permease [Mycoplasmopsis caviae]|uniref:ABC transporter ATP-binding protein/permease n=1 Tax=Mycoplasmopsis caviae TaxID=55603 RepID=A0ABY5IZU1_9BACT|nr:ABC transporter ATP-binding protein [Mycoplasmopsis caviae]UUD35665.1 ABC transporter ATP-binding protein/permease [Mycoplasmopsis caviae]